MSAQSSGRTPRSSTSSQPSASSSISRKLQGKTNLDPLSGSDNPLDVSVGDGDQDVAQTEGMETAEGEGQEDRQYRRQRPRTSGGFLLQESLPPHTSEKVGRNSAKASDVVKGKRRVDGGRFGILKKATGHPIVDEAEADRHEYENASDSRSDQSHSYNSGETRHSPSPRSSTSTREASHRRSLLGQDTDPAAIVNLALSLSESRRRNISGATTFISNDTLGGRRNISGNTQTLGIPYGSSGGSLRQHLREQRRISRNISPRSDGVSSRKTEGASAGQEKRQYSGSQPSERSLEDDVVFNASDATLARAEKARIALELGYEYRRLLRYLPPLPRTAQSTDKDGHAHNAHSGRAYNPLQYVRNRKVRFREKKPLNPESDGWKDVGRVRAWIDTVKSQSEVESFTTDGSFALPPFEAVADEPTVIDSIDSPSASQSKNLSATPSARPKLDWIFAPSDLLADIYWLHQNHNIQRIEDRSWQKIYQTPHSTKSGQKVTSKGSPTSPDSVNSTRSETSSKQARYSAINQHFDSYERGRLPKSRHQLASSIDAGRGSRFRKGRWSKKLLGSRSSSSSGHSDSSDQSRHHRSRRMQDGFDNAALEKHMMDIINREAEESRLPGEATNGDKETPDAKLNGSANIKEARTSHDDLAGLRLLGTKAQDDTVQPIAARHSIENERRHRRLSSDDILTAPTSPIIPGLAPSIAVDFSPPESPQNQAPVSTLSPSKKALSTGLGPFRKDRSRSVSVQQERDEDPWKKSASSRTKPGVENDDSKPRRTTIKEQAPLALHDSLAPTGNELASSMTRLQDSRHVRNAKNVSSSDHKRRGFFKGGRIAEIVGNEVSKVGDILWRRDSTHHVAQPHSSAPSSHPSDASDDEENGTSFVESNPSEILSRVTTNHSGIEMKSSKAASERQRYYMNNLPSFRSQAVGNDQPATQSASIPVDDHIARQQRMMKERGRSFKFDRLAPPRIDMRSVSPSPSPVISRSQSQDPRNDTSRGSSSSRSTRGTRIADRRLNDMLGIPGRVGTGKVGVTGLAAFSSHGRREHDRGRPHIKKQWSISDRGIATVDGTITKRDIARVRALLLSSGIKANEIARRNDETPSKPSSFLQELQDVMKEPVPLIPVSQEVVFAARTLVTDIEDTHDQLRDGAESFSTDTVDRLHNQIKSIDDQVNYKITPLVRAAADDADAFSLELTTTHTLAVRQLNVSIDGILRRRRRRLRWITRGGWAMLEWTVLGVMWVVWFIVVIIRIIRGTIKAVIGTVRWLLFL